MSQITQMKHFNKIFYAAMLLLSAAFLFFGNRIASGNMFVSDFEMMPTYTARVVEIAEINDMTEDFGIDWGFITTSIIVTFYAEISSGEMTGQIVRAEQVATSEREKLVHVGDRVLLMYNDFNHEFWFIEYVRTNTIIILAVVFFIMLVIFAGIKGFNSIISLGFICMAIFLVFIPAILSGMNIYLTAAIISLYAIVSTLLIIIGPNKKAVSAILGCLGGILFAGVMMYSMDVLLHLTGLIDHETSNLLNIPTPVPIDIRAVIFAGVIIGCTGAIMDVAMSISSSLWEVNKASAAPSFKSIFKSGLEIGKDILGTMLNTLILAYIGSSISLIILISASNVSLVELLNTELIIVEFLRALVGGFGMFLTMPLTSAICGWLFMKKNPNQSDFEQEEI